MTHTKDTLTVSRDFYKEAHNLAEKNLKLEATNADLLEALELALGSVQWMADATDSDPEDHERLAIVQEAIQKARES